MPQPILAHSVENTQSPRGIFAEKISRIAIEGSGIPPALWDASTTALDNADPHGNYEWGEAEHPLYDALGWEYRRFWKNRPEDFGIAILDASGDIWQIVLPDRSPRGYGYKAPKGIGNKAFFPAIDPESLAKIGERYGFSPDPERYWEQFKALGLPLTVTEGAKKCLAAIGQGVICCAVYGNSCLKSPDLDEWKIIHIAMDQDSGFNSKGESKRTNTIRQVLAGSKYLKARGCEVSFIVWDSRDGKGLDDLLINSPIKFFDAIDNPKPKLISIESRINAWEDSDFDHIATSKEELEKLIATLPGLIFIDGATGTGKTEALVSMADDHNLSHIAVTPLRSLCFGVANALDLAIFNDGARGEIDDRVSVVVNSLFKVKPIRAFNLYLDEFEQSLDNLYRGKLCRSNRDKRVKGFEYTVKNAQKTILLSATALPKDLGKIEEITGQRATRIRYRPAQHHPKPALFITHGNGEPGASATAAAMGIQALAVDMQAGKRAIVATDSARNALELSLMGKAWGLQDDQILLYSQESLSDPRVQDFRKCPNKGEWIDRNGIKLLIYSPIMTSGDSIKDPGKQLFDARYAFLTGKSIAPAQALQLINRYRSSLPINIVAPIRGNFTPLIRGNADDANQLGKHLGHGGFLIDSYALGNDRALDWEYREYLEAFVAWARRDGHDVALDPVGHIPEIQRQKLDREIQEWRALPIMQATPIDDARAKIIKTTPEPTIADSLSLRAWEIRRWHGMPWDSPLTIDQIIEEGFGKETKRFKRILELAIEGQAMKNDQSALADLGDCPYLHDLPVAQFRLDLWDKLGILEILEYCLKNPYSQNDPTLRAWWDGLLSFQNDFIKYPKLLGFRFFPGNQQDYGLMIKTIGTIFASLGIKTKSSRSRADNLVRTYSVDPESWQALANRLARYIEESGSEARSTSLGRLLLSALDRGANRGANHAQSGKNQPQSCPSPRAREGDR